MGGLLYRLMLGRCSLRAVVLLGKVLEGGEVTDVGISWMNSKAGSFHGGTDWISQKYCLITQ